MYVPGYVCTSLQGRFGLVCLSLQIGESLFTCGDQSLALLEHRLEFRDFGLGLHTFGVSLCHVRELRLYLVHVVHCGCKLLLSGCGLESNQVELLF